MWLPWRTFNRSALTHILLHFKDFAVCLGDLIFLFILFSWFRLEPHRRVQQIQALTEYSTYTASCLIKILYCWCRPGSMSLMTDVGTYHSHVNEVDQTRRWGDVNHQPSPLCIYIQEKVGWWTTHVQHAWVNIISPSSVSFFTTLTQLIRGWDRLMLPLSGAVVCISTDNQPRILSCFPIWGGSIHITCAVACQMTSNEKNSPDACYFD